MCLKKGAVDLTSVYNFVWSSTSSCSNVEIDNVDDDYGVWILNPQQEPSFRIVNGAQRGKLPMSHISNILSKLSENKCNVSGCSLKLETNSNDALVCVWSLKWVC